MTTHPPLPDCRHHARAILCAGLLCLLACGERVVPPADDCSTDGDPLPTEPLPDLGPDAVVCGEPGDAASTQEEIAALAGCQIYLGRLSLGRLITDRSPLATLRVIEGGIGAGGYNSEVETLDGLEQLQSVGEFTFFSDGLRELSGVRNLREVEGYFRLRGMPNLTHLDGLERLRTTGRLDLFVNPVLVSIDGLAGLRQVDGDLRIDGNPELTGVDCLASLERVTGDVYIRDNPKVPRAQIEALVSRIEVGGQVHLD